MITTNPEQITKINLIAENSNSEKKTVKTITESFSKTIESSWPNRPEAGNYKLYAEFYDWNGNVKESNKISVNIN